MASVRWPTDAATRSTAGWRRRSRCSASSAGCRTSGRRHVTRAPADLVERLRANGFRDVGGGHVMVLEDPGGAARPCASGELGAGRDAARDRTARRTRGPGDLDDVGLVLAESFGAPPGRAAELAADLRLTLDRPAGRCSCSRASTGSPPRPPRRRRSTGSPTCRRSGRARRSGAAALARIVTRHALALGGGAARGRAYLGVFSGNEPALRVYGDLGFASLGESPDLLLE